MSRADRYDRADFEVRCGEPVLASRAQPASGSTAAAVLPSEAAPREQAPSSRTLRTSRRVIWPIAPQQLVRVGESVLKKRKGKDRPHKGIDLFAATGTAVRAASDGQVIRVVDGRKSPHEGRRRAGLFVDVRGADALVFRYLHLGEAHIEPGASVRQGTVLGVVAAAHTSGLSDAPHLHFEVRQGDYDRRRKDYGTPVDPLRVLPPLAA